MVWDKEYSFEEINKFLDSLIELDLNKCDRGKKTQFIRTLYGLIGKIQLWNGCRVSEGMDAFIKYCESGKDELKVRARKKKREEYRTIIIPFYIKPCLRHAFMLYIDTRGMDRVIRNMKVFFSVKGYNTHNFRYAFITKMSQLGYPSGLISKMIRHSKISTLSHYIQRKNADEVLKEFVKMKKRG